MKNIFLTGVLLCSIGLAWGQQDQDVDLYSNSEKFADSAGRLIQKEYIRSGHVLDCNIQILHITDLVNGTRRNALRFINSQNKAAYLDEDEIAALTLSMHTIHDKVLMTDPANYTEVNYKSRSGFEAGCYTDTKNQWQTYLRLKHHDDTTFVLMKKSDFEVFLQILDNVKAHL